MGIYPTTVYKEHGDTVVSIHDDCYGLVSVKVYKLITTIEDRKTCFCCSCGEREASDIACRNHGWAAERPCEKHQMEGVTWGEEMCNCPEEGKHEDNCLQDKMPTSVQEANRGESDG